MKKKVITKLNINKATKKQNKYTFKNTVKGNFNSIVYDASKEIVKKLDKGYSPVFIYGKTGSGKTHFLKTIENEIKAKNPRKKVKYIPCVDFVQEFVNGIRDSKANKFKNKYRSFDVLLIDDIDILNGKQQTQEEIINMFNDIYTKDKLIVFSSNLSQNRLSRYIDKRLMSRFSWGLTLELKQLNYSDRIQILKNHLRNLGKRNAIDEKVIEYIAKNKKSDIRELEGAINKVLLYIRITKQKNYANDIKRILK